MSKICFIDSSDEKLGNQLLIELKSTCYVDTDFTDDEYHIIFFIGDIQLSPSRKKFLRDNRNSHFFFIPLENDNTTKLKSYLKKLDAEVTDFSDTVKKYLVALYWNQQPFIPSVRDDVVFLGDKNALGNLNTFYKLFICDDTDLHEYSGCIGLVVSKDLTALPSMLFKYLSHNITPIIDAKSFSYFLNHRHITFPSENIVCNGDIDKISHNITTLQTMQNQAREMKESIVNRLYDEITQSLIKPLKFKTKEAVE